MKLGTCLWFRGSFGFLSCDDGSDDLFCHWSALDGPDSAHKMLEPGDRVEYEVGFRNGKRIAINVHKLEARHGSNQAGTR